jgi:alcohol dehydrogenase
MYMAMSELDKIAGIVTDKVVNEMRVGRFYRFLMPATVLVGEGATIKLGEEMQRLNVKRALIVTDKDLVRLGLTVTTVNSLERVGIEVWVFDNVLSDPTEEMVYDGLRMAKEKDVDVIVGIGGGSPIDVAKAISIMVTNEGDISDYEGVDKVKNNRLPLVAIATTAGTGTEVTSAAVITNVKQNKKMVIIDRALIPDIAVVDPRLTLGIPPRVTAATGFDVLSHAIEAYCSVNSITISNALSHRAVMLVANNLRKAVGNGQNIEARHRMSVASLIAGIAFSNVGLGACHSTAHQIGTMYDLPHGVANAIMLPAVMEFNSLVRPDKMKEIAAAMGERVENLTDREAAKVAVRSVRELAEDLGLPTRLSEVGGKEEDFSEMARQAFEDPTLAANPRKASVEDIIKLYKAVW